MWQIQPVVSKMHWIDLVKKAVESTPCQQQPILVCGFLVMVIV